MGLFGDWVVTKFAFEGYFGPHGHVLALLAPPPPKARAPRGAERAHALRKPQGIRAHQYPERMDCACQAATAWRNLGQKCDRDLLFYWGLKRKFETPAMVSPLVARGSMAQAQLYHEQSGLLTHNTRSVL